MLSWVSSRVWCMSSILQNSCLLIPHIFLLLCFLFVWYSSYVYVPFEIVLKFLNVLFCCFFFFWSLFFSLFISVWEVSVDISSGSFIFSQPCLVYWWAHQGILHCVIVFRTSSIFFGFFLRVSMSLLTLSTCAWVLSSFIVHALNISISYFKLLVW